MSVVTVVELLAESDESWEDAARKAVEELAATLSGSMGAASSALRSIGLSIG